MQEVSQKEGTMKDPVALGQLDPIERRSESHLILKIIIITQRFNHPFILQKFRFSTGYIIIMFY